MNVATIERWRMTPESFDFEFLPCSCERIVSIADAIPEPMLSAVRFTNPIPVETPANCSGAKQCPAKTTTTRDDKLRTSCVPEIGSAIKKKACTELLSDAPNKRTHRLVASWENDVARVGDVGKSSAVTHSIAGTQSAVCNVQLEMFFSAVQLAAVTSATGISTGAAH